MTVLISSLEKNETWKCSEKIPREGQECETPAGEARDLIENLKAPPCLVPRCGPFQVKAMGPGKR